MEDMVGFLQSFCKARTSSLNIYWMQKCKTNCDLQITLSVFYDGCILSMFELQNTAKV
jgi:hypothetical protein